MVVVYSKNCNEIVRVRRIQSQLYFTPSSGVMFVTISLLRNKNRPIHHYLYETIDHTYYDKLTFYLFLILPVIILFCRAVPYNKNRTIHYILLDASTTLITTNSNYILLIVLLY